ncbi:hypothetical protein A5733_01810 [Mycobacterium sp. NS-7484]|uniref:hypothetical protein n=1 Tax=unclassified Mycobacterium TaxID=2642494 RepID=UPI0007FC145D|nr:MULTISPECIES: hypothetical protein [unclassified Mycobacterium]OBG84911.1 hypothetical protein A5699_25580 [Mycobacterium sp. E802]OMB94963.1 hypothetical protein A5733_01810 [Mycobacterium sp. NS-7484]
MQAAAHPYLAAGVALVGAGAIAMSPVAPPMPDISVPAITSAQVNLSAAADPIEAYAQLFSNTIANVSTLIDTEITDPAPVLLQVISNQLATASSLFEGLQGAGEGLAAILDPANPVGIPAQLQLAVSDLLAGNINGAVANAWSALLSPVLNAALPLLEPITAAIRQPIQNLLNVVDTQLAILYPVLGAINVGYVTVTAAGNVGQDILDSIRTADPIGAVNALLSGPAVITDALLNGDAFGGGVLGPGLGLLSTLRQARDMIAAAITPPAADATVRSTAKLVTLDVAPAVAKTIPAAETGGALSQSAADSEAVSKASGASEDSEAPATPTADETGEAKQSLETEPGKTATMMNKRVKMVTGVREGIQGTVKGMTKGLKNAAEGLTGKSGKTDKAGKADKSRTTKSRSSAKTSSSRSGDAA